MRVILVIVALLLGGCSTKYHEMGFTGGVAAEPVMTDVYRIIARGNGYTSADRVQDFALLKAAETTLAAGASHFVIVDQANRTRVDVVQSPGTVQTSVVGRTAVSTYTPGSTDTFIKPGESLIIRVVRLKPGEPPPTGALPAQDLVNTLGPRLKQES